MSMSQKEAKWLEKKSRRATIKNGASRITNGSNRLRAAVPALAYASVLPVPLCRRAFRPPDTIGVEFLDIWSEFEKRISPEAKFAAAIDSLQPLMNHLLTKSPKNKEHQVRTHQVLQKKRHIEEGSTILWEYAKKVIRGSEDLGLYLK